MVTLAVLTPTLVAGVGAVCALVFDMLRMPRAAVLAAVAGAAAAAVAAPAVPTGDAAHGMGVPLIETAVCLLAAVVLIGGWRRLVASPHGAQTASLGLLSLASSLLVLVSRDLVVLIVGLEAMGLSAYALTASGGTDEARESAMKYLIQGAVATGLLVVGVAVMLAATGGASGYDQVAGATGGGVLFPRAAALLAWAFVVSVFAFKAGAFPFHSWALDVYEHSEPPVAGLLASVPKVAAVAAFAQLVARPGLTSDGWSVLPAGLIALVAAGSIIFGNLSALRQTSFRRMLGYSGIAQVGYALTGVAAGAPGAATLCIALYGLGAAGAFLAAEAIHEADPGWDGRIATLAGLGRSRPALSAAITALMLSMTGVPLMAGFLGKLVVFYAAVASGWTWLVVLGVAGSVVSFGYYGRVLRTVYLADDDWAGEPVEGRSGPAQLATVALAVVVVVMGAAPLFAGGAFWLTLPA